MKQPDTKLVDEHCEEVARRHVLEELHAEDDETAFHENSSFQFEQIQKSVYQLRSRKLFQKRLDNTTTSNPKKILFSAVVRQVAIPEDTIFVGDTINHEASGKIVET